ncbi:hypothetical protein J4727_07390 [Providencia rettgeri]|uniref:Uncharacterized protein n=1 Tax=Providencia rettgeri TaxID=587 RepID=A0A939NBN9_PRORE|nr:hypothetical protein [Providencia rettgeri]
MGIQSNRRSLDARMREEEQVRLGQDAEVAPTGSAASIAKMTSLYNSNKGVNNGSDFTKPISARCAPSGF